MSRLRTSVLAAVGILAAVVAVVAVYVAVDRTTEGDELDDSLIGATTSPKLNDEGDATSAGAVAPSTPRGLAVAVLDHLGDRRVTSVAVGGKTRRPIVSIATDDPAVASVFVMVGPLVGGLLPCGADAGYTRVSCETDPLREVVRRTARGRWPTYIGRAEDDTRHSVLIEVHGDRNAPAVAALVQGLVDDDLLGAVTSALRNDRGADLEGVESLTLTSTLEVG